MDIEKLKVDEALWPKAPTHYIIDHDPEFSGGAGFFWEEDGRYVFVEDGKSYWRKDSPSPLEIIPRPTKDTVSVEWDGEGLPPVGEKLDYVIGDDRYPVTVVGHFEGEVVVFQHESDPDYVGVQPGYLYPHRTKEQQDRDEMAAILKQRCTGTADNYSAIANDIIAAGWRKES